MNRLHLTLCQLLLITALVWAQREDNYRNDINFCDSVPAKVVEIPAHFMINNTEKSFRSVVQNVECPTDSKVEQITTSTDDPNFLFYPSGEIVVPDKHYIPRSEYCVKRIGLESIEIKTCNVTCGETHACIHKCCPPHQIIDVSSTENTSSCVQTPNKIWEPVFYSKYKGCGTRIGTKDIKYRLLVTPEIQNSVYLPYKHIHVHHSEYNESTRHEGFRFRLMSDGHIMSQGVGGKWQSIKPGEFCIDGMTGYIGNDKHLYKRLEDQVFVAFEDSNSSYEMSEYDDENAEVIDRVSEYFYIPLMFIGATFLLLTLILYILIWEKHNIHGWTIFAFVATMLFMFIFLAISKIFSIHMTDEFGGTSGCQTVGILAHFFYLSTICWLTVINLDLWLTFRNVKPGGGKSQSVTRFIFYSLFAFGIPFLIVSFAVTVDFTYLGSFGDGTECEPPFTLPLYGQQNCYIQPEAHWYYLYIPMAILLTCNILTFSSTVFSLCMYRNQTRNATSGTSHQHESLVLFGKLFIVTGLSWVLELISFAAPDLWGLWIVFDGYNLLQAVLIFIIFALKREHLLFLYHKYPSLRFSLIPIMRTSCCYAESFDPEKTDVTAIPFDRNSRIHFRRGSNMSTTSSTKGVAYR